MQTYHTLSPGSAETVRRHWRAETEINGQPARLVGGWIDLAGFYATADGAVYSLQRLSAYGGDSPQLIGNLSDIPKMFRNLRGGMLP